MLSSRSLTCAVLGLALIAPAFLGGCDRQPAEESQPKADAGGKAKELTGVIDRSRAGEPIPQFTVSDAAGDTLELASFAGKPLLINLWATWCAPCVVELPMLNQIAQEREGELKVLTISQDMQNPEKVAPFLAERGLDRLEPWLDPKSDLMFALEAQTLPMTILYSADGKEIWRYVGGNDWTSDESAEMLSEAF